jgi:hypothetical protein
VLLTLLLAFVALLVGTAITTMLLAPNQLTALIRPGAGPSTATGSAAATASSAAATSSSATAAPSASDTATPKSTPSAASSAAVAAMKACRERVQAADDVLDEARTGIRHWEAHVDAERRAEAHTISIAERQAIFKKTRQKGPGDQNRYADARRAYDKVKHASCGKPSGADAKVMATMAKCQDRATAQRLVLKAAAAAMGDWKQHLSDMQRSRVQHNKDAQQVWLNAYKAAPRNLKPYEKAVRTFKKAPKC